LATNKCNVNDDKPFVNIVILSVPFPFFLQPPIKPLVSTLDANRFIAFDRRLGLYDKRRRLTRHKRERTLRFGKEIFVALRLKVNRKFFGACLILKWQHCRATKPQERLNEIIKSL